MPKFKVGDEIEATCEYGQPYSQTCEGWTGVVHEVFGDWANDNISVGEKSWPSHRWFSVDSRFFRLKRSAKKRSTFKDSPYA